jgi:hypothetical protein
MKLALVLASLNEPDHLPLSIIQWAYHAGHEWTGAALNDRSGIVPPALCPALMDMMPVFGCLPFLHRRYVRDFQEAIHLVAPQADAIFVGGLPTCHHHWLQRFLTLPNIYLPRAGETELDLTHYSHILTTDPILHAEGRFGPAFLVTSKAELEEALGQIRLWKPGPPLEYRACP